MRATVVGRIVAFVMARRASGVEDRLQECVDSRKNEPSKAITGGAIGEFVHPSEDRFLTLRECARLQTFPDWFAFRGTKAERSLLIGNAVPPLLAEVVARGLAKDLRDHGPQDGDGALLSFVPALSDGMSPALQQVTNRIGANFSNRRGASKAVLRWCSLRRNGPWLRRLAHSAQADRASR